MTRDEHFMSLALAEAAKAKGRTSPNPMVGCILVRKGKIVARGYHHKAGEPHAEIEALKKLKDLRGLSLYVTLEPCAHYGRTPPCAEAILKSGIRDVVVGMKDPDPKVSGKGIRLLKKNRIRVRVGVLEEECRDLNRAYITHRTEHRPYVTLKIAMTRDGKIAVKKGHKTAPLKITGPAADRFTHELRDQTDAILVGAGTIRSDDPRLTTRLKKNGKNPIRIIVKGKTRLSLKAKVFRDGEASTWVFKGPRGKADLSKLLSESAQKGVLSLLVEGGHRIWKSFLEQKAVDRVLVFVSPKIYGPKGWDVSTWLVAALQKAGFSTNRMKISKLGRDLLCEFT